VIHRAAAEGFSRAAAEYERSRPGYPPEAVTLLQAELGVGPGANVVDVAAGTGKLTRLLAATGATVTAIEPVSAMRDVLMDAVPGVEALDGTAEAMPLPAASADVVTAAQAFHWFDTARALEEIARVLRPGGGLALLFNVRDESAGWLAEMGRIIQWHDRDIDHYGNVDWAGTVVASSDRFTPVEHRSFRWEQPMTVDLFVERVASISFIAAMSEDERRPYLERSRALVSGFDEPFGLPYRTDVHWCRRR
jgi:SAM-dependent methyltransferase